MGVALFQVAFAGSSGLPKDVYVNTYHADLGTGEPTEAQCEDVADEIEASYLDTDGADRNILSWLSEEVNTTIRIKAYLMSDPVPRAPLLDKVYSIAGGTTGNGRLAAEVALCLSFQGDTISGSPQARRRGRVFVGPLRPTANDSATGRPATGFRDTMQHFGNELYGRINALAGWTWGVWSGADADFVPITNGWIDNAFDTQRRRGLAPVSRVIFPS